MNARSQRTFPRTGYPRQRAVTACQVCRERKKKCDNVRPTCTSCLALGARCQYPGHEEASFDAASLAIMNRLSTIESLIRQQNTQPTASDHSSKEADRSIADLGGQIFTPAGTNINNLPNQVFWTIDTSALWRVRVEKVLDWPVFEMPLSSLQRFSLLNFKQEVEYSYLADFTWLQNHSHEDGSVRPAWWELTTPMHISTEPADIERLVERFFSRVHIKNPILERRTVTKYCQEYCEEGPQFNLRSCLILLVCALGCVASDFEPDDQDCRIGDGTCWAARTAQLKLGHTYFAAAEKRIGSAITRSNSLAVQCLCLAGIYHMYTLNSIAAKSMFHAAGVNLKNLISLCADPLQRSALTSSGLFWACYKSERELFPELPINLPALVAPDQISGYPLPPMEQFLQSTKDIWTLEDEDSWYYFLSEIAIRGIKDKIAEAVGTFFHRVAHAPLMMDRALEDLIPINSEFERQLMTWRQNLPPRLQFRDASQPTDTEWQLHLRNPFYFQLELIHWPFIYAAIHDSNSSPIVMRLAGNGLAHTCNYLRSGHATLRHHGRWMQLRYELTSMCILWAASATHVQMPAGWYEAIQIKTESFRYWSLETPFYNSYIEVVHTLEQHFSTIANENMAEIALSAQGHPQNRVSEPPA